MWQLSIRSKIILVLLLTGLACLAAGGLIGYRAGEAALTQSVEGRLTAQRELKRRRVEAYINNQLRFTTAIASSAETIEAAKALIAAFREMRGCAGRLGGRAGRRRRARGLVQQGFTAAPG